MKHFGENIPKSIRLIAFDWDGTLIDSVPYKLRQNKDLALVFGNDLTLDQVRKIWSESQRFDDLMQQLCQTDDMETIMAAVRREYDNPNYAKRAFAFTAPALDQIRDTGRDVALVTNLTTELLETDATSLGLDLTKYFTHIQTSDTWKYKKPDGRVFRPLIDNYDIHPNELLYVGDEIKDALAARACGAAFLGVETGMATADEFAARGFRSIKSIKEL